MPDDRFGVRMIYPTRTGTNNHEWYVNSDASNFLDDEGFDRRSDSEGDYFQTSSDQVRANTLTRHGYKQDEINTDASEIDYNTGGTGQMQEGYDTWRDVEITAYVFVTQGCTGDQDFTWYCRGGRHGDNAVDNCEGQAMKCSWHWCDGRTRFRKEQRHPSDYVSTPWREAFGGSIRNKWVGAKFVCYNVEKAPTNPEASKAYNVKMESWIDKNNDNNWTLVNSAVDTGGDSIWTEGSICNCCSGERGQIMTWSGPLAVFRWDNTGVRIKKMSVREINPGGGFTPPPPGPTPPGPSPPPPPGGSPPPPPPSDSTENRLVYPSSGITASSVFEGNSPDRVNDDNFTTGWVGAGLPIWILVDMQAKKRVSFIRINWADPTTYTMFFTIETSEDNVVYRQMFATSETVQGNGPTEFMNQYDLEDHNARFVRITISTNSSGNGGGIGELHVYGNNTPIGEEPDPGGPLGRDPNSFYRDSTHVFHINFQTTDACNPDQPPEGSGPNEDAGIDEDDDED